MESVLLICPDGGNGRGWSRVLDFEGLTERLGEHGAATVWDHVAATGRHVDSSGIVTVPAPATMPPAAPISRATWHNRPAPSSDARVAFRFTYRNLRRSRREPGLAAAIAWGTIDRRTCDAAVKALFRRMDHVFSVAASRTVSAPYTFESALRANLESARYRKVTQWAAKQWARRLALHYPATA